MANSGDVLGRGKERKERGKEGKGREQKGRGEKESKKNLHHFLRTHVLGVLSRPTSNFRRK